MQPLRKAADDCERNQGLCAEVVDWEAAEQREAIDRGARESEQ
jgi:hypothetical protein